jgi:hypothetical protein
MGAYFVSYVSSVAYNPLCQAWQYRVCLKQLTTSGPTGLQDPPETQRYFQRRFFPALITLPRCEAATEKQANLAHSGLLTVGPVGPWRYVETVIENRRLRLENLKEDTRHPGVNVSVFYASFNHVIEDLREDSCDDMRESFSA